jgi:hypothetical protein
MAASNLRLASGLQLNVCNASDAATDEGTMSWVGGATGSPLPLSPIVDPKAAFTHIFGTTTGGTGTPPPNEAASRTRLRKSMLDSVLGDYDILAKQLPLDERRLVDHHFSLLRDQEMRLHCRFCYRDSKSGSANRTRQPMRPHRRAPHARLDLITFGHWVTRAGS